MESFSSPLHSRKQSVIKIQVVLVDQDQNFQVCEISFSNDSFVFTPHTNTQWRRPTPHLILYVAVHLLPNSHSGICGRTNCDATHETLVGRTEDLMTGHVSGMTPLSTRQLENITS